MRASRFLETVRRLRPSQAAHRVRLWSTDGEAYLDCVAGIATDALGHAHPKLVAALNCPTSPVPSREPLGSCIRPSEREMFGSTATFPVESIPCRALGESTVDIVVLASSS